MSRVNIKNEKMKSLRFLTIALVLASVTLLSSCKKKGCTDFDGDNYDSQAEKSTTCYYRYGNTVSVVSSTSVNYDPFDGPDLYIKFAKNSSSSWDYITTAGSNNYNLSATFTDFFFTNEQWDFEVYDDDTLDPDDIVCSGSFNPLTDGVDGVITVYANGCTVKFDYTVSM